MGAIIRNPPVLPVKMHNMHDFKFIELNFYKIIQRKENTS